MADASASAGTADGKPLNVILCFYRLKVTFKAARALWEKMKRVQAGLVAMINVKVRVFNKYKVTSNAFRHFHSAARKRPANRNRNRNRNSSIRVRVERPLTFYPASLVGNHKLVMNERSLLIRRGNTDGSEWRSRAFHRNMMSWERHVPPAERIFYRSWTSADREVRDVDLGRGRAEIPTVPVLTAPQSQSNHCFLFIQPDSDVRRTGWRGGALGCPWRVAPPPRLDRSSRVCSLWPFSQRKKQRLFGSVAASLRLLGLVVGLDFAWDELVVGLDFAWDKLVRL